MKKAIVIVVAAVLLLLAVIPKTHSVRIKQEDMAFLSSFAWNDTAVLERTDFEKLSEDVYALHYGENGTIAVSFTDDQGKEKAQDAAFQMTISDSAVHFPKMAVWFSRDCPVQRTAEGVYKNVSILINEPQGVRKNEAPAFIQLLKTKAAEAE